MKREQSFGLRLPVILAAIGMLAVTVAVAGAYVVVDANQKVCYDDTGGVISPSPGDPFYGQDAQYTGTIPSYLDNGDGTVTDLNTGLIWQQSPAANSLTWSEAVSYCDDLELAEYSDWRMPTLKELFAISDFETGWPYLNSIFDLAGTSQMKDEQYWCDNYYVGLTHGGQETAFGINHGTGHIKAYPADSPPPFGNLVRAVRGEPYGENQFVDNGDGTVTDLNTGLIWQQADCGTGLDWEDALAYAEDLTVGGYDDWRLPDVHELQSIVDYTHSPNAIDAEDLGPAIDTDFFTITPLPSGSTIYDPDYGYFWTSTSAYFGLQDPDYCYGWYVAFGTAPDSTGTDMHGAGGVRYDQKSEESTPMPEGDGRVYNFVRCVRNSGTGVEEGEGGPSTALSLEPSGPNPFRSMTAFSYDLPAAGYTNLSVFDLSGRRVATLVDGVLPSGSGSVAWDASGTPAGVYVCILSTSDSQVTRSVVRMDAGH